MTTIKELIDQFKEFKTEFEFEGEKYHISKLYPTVQEQDGWAHYQHTIDKMRQDDNTFRQMRLKSIAEAPTSKRIGDKEYYSPLTASERIAEAEILYQWLIKDLK